MARRALGVVEDALVECCSPLAQEALSAEEAHAMALVYAALADPVRLRLLSLVASVDEICSCNLEGPLAKSQPTVSHHTRILAEAGLIVGQKRGRWMWWSVVPDRLKAAAAFLQP